MIYYHIMDTMLKIDFEVAAVDDDSQNTTEISVRREINSILQSFGFEKPKTIPIAYIFGELYDNAQKNGIISDALPKASGNIKFDIYDGSEKPKVTYNMCSPKELLDDLKNILKNQS